MDLAQFVFQTAVTLNRIAAAQARPTTFDHRQAEMRGLVLCVMCGTELTNPQASQVCGACEEKAGSL